MSTAMENAGNQVFPCPNLLGYRTSVGKSNSISLLPSPRFTARTTADKASTVFHYNYIWDSPEDASQCILHLLSWVLQVKQVANAPSQIQSLWMAIQFCLSKT